MYLGSKMAGEGTVGKTSGMDWLRNDVVFTWGFVEMVWLFWVSLVSCILCLGGAGGRGTAIGVRRKKYILTWSGTDLQHIAGRAPTISYGCGQERGADAGSTSMNKSTSLGSKTVEMGIRKSPRTGCMLDHNNTDQ